jgi:hypothetical protein
MRSAIFQLGLTYPDDFTMLLINLPEERNAP